MSIGPDELSLCYGHDACREVALEYCLEYIYDRENDHGDTDAVYRKVKGIINSWNLKMYIVEKGEIEYRKSCVKDAKHLERLNKALTCHEQFENLVVFSVGSSVPFGSRSVRNSGECSSQYFLYSNFLNFRLQ